MAEKTHETPEIPQSGLALKIAALATDAIVKSGDNLLTAFGLKPDQFSTSQWLEGIIFAAKILSLHFDEEALRKQAEAITTTEGEADLAATVVGFSTFLTTTLSTGDTGSTPDDENDEDDEDEESTSTEIDILNDVGQELSAIQQRITYILSLDTQQTEYLALVALNAEINEKLLDRISIVTSLLRGITKATEEADRYKRKIDQEIFPDIIKAEAHVQSGIFEQAKSATADMKGRGASKKSSYPFRSTSSNSGPADRPTKTKRRKPKSSRTGGGQRTGK